MVTHLLTTYALADLLLTLVLVLTLDPSAAEDDEILATWGVAAPERPADRGAEAERKRRQMQIEMQQTLGDTPALSTISSREALSIANVSDDADAFITKHPVFCALFLFGIGLAVGGSAMYVAGFLHGSSHNSSAAALDQGTLRGAPTTTGAPTSISTDTPTAMVTDAPTVMVTDAPTAITTDAPTAMVTDAPTSITTEDSASRPVNDYIRGKARQVNNYIQGKALAITIHITHHAGTALCGLMKQAGPAPASSCMGNGP